MKREIKIGGTGGQGVILAAVILADAAIMEGYNVVQSQSYGAEARGGDSSADVIISDEEIDYPKVEKADILLGMNWGSIEKFAGVLVPEGLVIYDSTLNGHKDCSSFPHLIEVPITAIAKEQFGSSGVANMVALGVLIGITEIVSKENLSKALVGRVPAGSREKNLAAMEAGYATVTEGRTK